MNAKSLRYLSSFILALLLGIGLVAFSIFALSGQVDTKDTATVGLVTLIWGGLVTAFGISIKYHHEVMTGRRDESN